MSWLIVNLIALTKFKLGREASKTNSEHRSRTALVVVNSEVMG